MYERWVQNGDLGLGRLLRVFAGLAVVFVAVLAIAPARSHFREWRAVQGRYNRLAAASGAAPVVPAVQQVWKPTLALVDRCPSCHLGMGAASPLPGERLFAAHPQVAHDPADLGCTPCHGGQGRATVRPAAHGRTLHWDPPILAPAHFEAG
jgi:hypothetical protein